MTDDLDRLIEELRTEAVRWTGITGQLLGHAADALVRLRQELRDERNNALRVEVDLRDRMAGLEAVLREYARLGPDDIPYADTINDPPDVGRAARVGLAGKDSQR